MAAALQVIAKWAIPVGLAVGGVQSAMYDGKVDNDNPQKTINGTESNLLIWHFTQL